MSHGRSGMYLRCSGVKLPIRPPTLFDGAVGVLVGPYDGVRKMFGGEITNNNAVVGVY